ncbi:MAG: hypothetical protein WCD07_06455 [Burkholderiales bacterium]
MNASKKIILGCAFAITMVSGYANASGEISVTTDTLAKDDPTATTVTSGAYNGLVQTQFVFTRSRNVKIHSLANAAGTGAAVTSASAKGRNTFFANSGGSSASVCGTPAVGAAVPALWTITDAHTEAGPNCAGAVS